RPRRGLLSRPTVAETYEDRRHVDVAMQQGLDAADPSADALELIRLGLNHQQQHPELLLTDLKAAFAPNPPFPAYSARQNDLAPVQAPGPARWIGFAEGVYKIGHDSAGFAFDVEGPRHRVYLHGFELGSRLVTVGEYRAFMADGGYRRPE